MSRTRVTRLAAFCIALVLGISGCDTSIQIPTSPENGNGNGTGHTGTPTTGPSRVRISLPDTLFRSINDTLIATAQVFDAAGATVSGAVPAWSTTQPGIVALGAQAGLTIAQTPGVSLIIASYAGISDTARLTVRPVVTRFTIPQPMLTLSAIGATALASVTATDARGSAVSGAVIAYESSAPAVATVTAAGTVSAADAGTAFIRFQSGAARDSMRVTVTLPTPPTVTLSNGQQGIVDGTNTERAKYGIAPLAPNAALNHAADLTAAQLVKTGVFAHDIAGATYPTPEDRFKAAGYTYSAWGENIGKGPAGTTVTAMVAAWIASPGHHANMVNPGYTQIGVSIASAPDGTVYMVQEFGHP